MKMTATITFELDGELWKPDNTAKFMETIVDFAQWISPIQQQPTYTIKEHHDLDAQQNG
jgi:hypothetical protein